MGRRVYRAPIGAVQGMFMPSPQGLFNAGVESASAAKNNGRDLEKNTEDYLPLQKAELERQNVQLKLGLTNLKGRAYQLLKNEYHGDVQRFQEGEMKKYLDGDETSYYAELLNQTNQNSIYSANQSLAKMNREMWQSNYDKLEANQAFTQVLETPDGKPIYNNNGEAYTKITDPSDKKEYYVSLEKKGSPKIKAEDSDLPYMTQETWMNIQAQTGFENGMPRVGKYFESFDATKQYLATKLNKITENVKTSMSSGAGNSLYMFSGANGEQFIKGLANEMGKGGDAMEAAMAAHVFIGSVYGKTSTNTNAIAAATQLIRGALDENELRDAKQQWYAAQQRGEGLRDAKTGKIKAGKDLDFDTWLAAKAASAFLPVARTEQETIYNLEAGGSELNATRQLAQENTVIENVTNPEYIKETTQPSQFVVPQKQQDGSYVYDNSMLYLKTTMDPFMINAINKSLTSESNDFETKFHTSPTSIGPSVVMYNGQAISTATLAAAGGRVKGVTGNAVVGPRFKRNPDGTMEQLTVKEISKDGKYQNAEEPYVEFEIIFDRVKKGRKNIPLIMPDEGKGGSYAKRAKMEEYGSVEYLIKELGVKYGENFMIDDSDRMVLKVIAPISESVMFDGALNNASKNNKFKLDRAMSRALEDDRNAALLEQISTQ